MKTVRLPLVVAAGLLMALLPGTLQAAWPGDQTFRYHATWNARYLTPFMRTPLPDKPYWHGNTEIEDHSFLTQLGLFYDRHYPWVYTEAYGWLWIVADNPIKQIHAYLVDPDAVRLPAGRQSPIGPAGWYILEPVYVTIIEYSRDPGSRLVDTAWWAQRVYSYEEERWRGVLLGVIYPHGIVHGGSLEAFLNQE